MAAWRRKGGLEKFEKRLVEGMLARGYDTAVHGESSYFVWINRGKESVCLDLKLDADRALLSRMKVFRLESLDDAALAQLLSRAVAMIPGAVLPSDAVRFDLLNAVGSNGPPEVAASSTGARSAPRYWFCVMTSITPAMP